MPLLQPQSEIITLEQYEALPEEKRAEVFDGVIYDMASPSQDHQTISIELSTIINTYIKSKKGSCRVFNAPFDVKLSDHPLTIVQPDIMVICDKNKLDGKRCNGSPDFIIEIVSPSNPSDDYLTIVQPDIMVICDKNKLDGKRCNGSPDFIIEIVSPSNPSDDYIRKLYYYKNYGVLVFENIGL